MQDHVYYCSYNYQKPIQSRIESRYVYKRHFVICFTSRSFLNLELFFSVVDAVIIALSCGVKF
jgi:hypothetical protein